MWLNLNAALSLFGLSHRTHCVFKNLIQTQMTLILRVILRMTDNQQ